MHPIAQRADRKDAHSLPKRSKVFVCPMPLQALVGATKPAGQQKDTVMKLKLGITLSAVAVALAGCASDWTTDYEATVGADVSRDWRVTDVQVQVPDSLTVSNANSFAPSADIVWHGDPPGDRRAQVAEILKAGIEGGSANLNGSRPVTIVAALQNFHGVTPISVSQAPAAVHNIAYQVQVFDSTTGNAITESTYIQADLEAFTGAAAVVATQQGQTQKVRVTNHLSDVTRGWLGTGPDVRRTFGSFGR